MFVFLSVNQEFTETEPPLGCCEYILHTYPSVYGVWGFIQKFPEWPPGVTTANGTALCH